MVEERGQRDTGSSIPSFERVRSTPPSPVAQARLSDALHDRAEAYRQDATLDLTILEALLKLDEPEAAVRQLDNHRAVLAAMARDLQVVVADAAVEREAERVCEASAAAVADVAVVAEPVGLRRRALALTSAAAVALLLVLPSGRLVPRTVLTSMEDRGSLSDAAAARERLEAAKTWARALRADQAAAAESDREIATRRSVVRKKVRAILAADGSGGPAATNPSVATVTDLNEHRARKAAAAGTEPAAEEPAGETSNDVAPAGEVESVRQAVPLKVDLDVDPGALTSEAAALPHGVDAPLP